MIYTEEKISTCFNRARMLFCVRQLKVSNWWSEEALKESGHFQRLFIFCGLEGWKSDLIISFYRAIDNLVDSA
jgi:hypothetical protein